MNIVLSDGKRSVAFVPIEDRGWLRKPVGEKYQSVKSRIVTPINMARMLNLVEKQGTRDGAVFFAVSPKQYDMVVNNQVKF